MATELTDLDVLEVSLVPKGANGKRFFLKKSTEEEPTMLDPKKIAELLKKEGPKGFEAFLKEQTGMTDEQRAAALALGRLLAPATDGMDDTMKADFAKALGLSAKEDPAPEPDPAKPADPAVKAEAPPAISKEDKAKLPESVQKALDAAEAESKRVQEQLAKQEETNKSLAAELKAQRDARTMDEMREVAKGLTVGQDVDTVATLLKNAKDRDALTKGKEYDTLLATLKSASASKEASDLFGEVGKSGGGSAGATADEVWGQIEKEADGMIEKSAAADNLTKAQAIDKVLQTEKGARLYARYEQLGGRA